MTDLVIRTTIDSDKEPILAFCANMSEEDNDYLPFVWERWLTDPHGLMLTATLKSIPIGVVHMTMLTKQDAWLQGIRVQPTHQHQGIGRALTEAAMLEAMKRGATSIRLLVEADNTISQHLAANMHLHNVGAFSLYDGTPLSSPTKKRGGQTALELATPEESDTIVDYLNQSNIFPLTGGLFYSHFTARPISVELIEQQIAEQQIYLLRRWGRIDGLAITEIDSDRHTLVVGYIDGTTIDAISLIAYQLRQRLETPGLNMIHVYAPDLVLVHDAFNGVEYTSDGTIFCTYERGLT